MPIDKSMEKNIKNYSKQIKTLKDYVEAVRTTYGVYIGYNNEIGCMHLIKEVFGNSIDELNRAQRGISPCTEIIVEFTEGPCITKVIDNGRGIPFDLAINIMTNLHTSSNYEKEKGDYTTGRHGMGIKVVNALSEFLILESHILGESRRIEFKEGKATTKEMVPCKSQYKQGTEITFAPTRQLMVGLENVKVSDVLKLIKDMSMLTPIGSVIYFKGTYPDGTVYTEKIVNEDGIITDLINKTTNPLVKPIYISNDTGEMKAEIAFTYDSDDLEIEEITSFCNCNRTSGGGTHVVGFMDGLTKFFRNYMNKIFLKGTKSKITVINNDIKTGLKCIISAALLNPAYGGQNKEILTSSEITSYISNLVYLRLESWSKENPNDLQKVCKYFKDVADVRVKSEAGKVKLKDKYQSSVLSDDPAKYIKPSGKTGLSLFICEGDSAAGSLENHRDYKTQGVFPIKLVLCNSDIA